MSDIKWESMILGGPKKDGKYLVTIVNKHDMSRTVSLACYRAKGFFNGKKWTTLDDSDVIAWAEVSPFGAENE